MHGWVSRHGATQKGSKGVRGDGRGQRDVKDDNVVRGLYRRFAMLATNGGRILCVFFMLIIHSGLLDLVATSDGPPLILYAYQTEMKDSNRLHIHIHNAIITVIVDIPTGYEHQLRIYAHDRYAIAMPFSAGSRVVNPKLPARRRVRRRVTHVPVLSVHSQIACWMRPFPANGSN